ncbi:hypothetical protein PFISCL1PPCAC_16223 [Pristionchus fissidentatus]|uniref:Sulfhydryl oxidase n=1 Tax=Pristionchus fissidentatus TaxID=1538716 RepID=A0AAV5VZC6_9BILA|nr:hypothetical protein PFISCL1PPCAC_16223 [Pristionchus fissidentatus]
MGRPLILIPLLVAAAQAIISSFNYVPQGSNPTLFVPGFEPVMHLDQATFDDTVFGQDHAFVVLFYADWCGHCRAFAPYYRSFANLVQNWNSIVTVTAINCADNFNQGACRDNGITHFPMIKYFPRTARSAQNAIDMEAQHSGELLRESLLRRVTNEYAYNRYPDWPAFHHVSVDASTTYGDLWNGVSPSANHMVIYFEVADGPGAQFLLDMASRANMVGAKRSLASSPLAQMLRVATFPSIALFRRDHQQALYMQPFSNRTYLDIDSIVTADRISLHQQVLTTTARPLLLTTTPSKPLIDCNANPERCRSMYYVSETDMLKAMRMALYDEVIKTGNFVAADNFTNLYEFVNVLSNHFPVLSFSADLRAKKRRSTSTILKNSERARMIFVHMREYLEEKKAQKFVSVDDWKRHFDDIEQVFNHPFPANSSWQHCQGTTPSTRGYTCGLWTTFHALTVHTYIDTIKDEEVDSLKPLKAIQGWVKSFFGCEHCKNHFMNMTTKLFPMNERRVRHPHDMMTYLWRAHNIVNQRLHGDATEDPQFIKTQFPPPFLCPTCHSGGAFSRRQVRNFLLRYYGSIEPHNRVDRRRLA